MGRDYRRLHGKKSCLAQSRKGRRKSLYWRKFHSLSRVFAPLRENRFSGFARGSRFA